MYICIYIYIYIYIYISNRGNAWIRIPALSAVREVLISIPKQQIIISISYESSANNQRYQIVI